MRNKYDRPIKQITNLEELRLAKKRLKSEIVVLEKSYDNSFTSKAFNLVSSFKYNENFASSKIEDSLNWLGNKASQRFPMNGVTKIVVSSLIMLATPIITSKIQEFIKNKLK